MKTEIEIKAEQMAMECAEKWAPNTADFLAAYILKHIPLADLLTVEAELGELQKLAADDWGVGYERLKQVEKELESTNMALKSSCQCAEQFKKERDELEKEIGEFQNDAKALIDGIAETNVDGAGSDTGRWQDFTIAEIGMGLNKLKDDYNQLRRNVATLYEWIQGNTSLTGKQKEAANSIFDQLDKVVKEDSDLRVELATAKAENSDLKLDIQRLNVKIAHLENALAAKEGK